MIRWTTSIFIASLAFSALGAGVRNENRNAALFQAIRGNDCQTVNKLLRSGVAAAAKNAAGSTALMYAALYADTGCMKLLLDKGADPNTANAAGATALMWSVHDIEKVKLLLGRGADPNARSKEGRTALLIAARQDGGLDAIKLLAAKGADLNAQDAAGGTALMLAAEAGDLSVVRYLVDHGAKLDEQASPGFGAPRFGNLKNEAFEKMPRDVKGTNALLIAAGSDNKEIVHFLLEKGADPKLKAFGIFDALLSSVQRKDPDITKALVEKGLDVNAREFRGATPLILAAASDEAGPATIRLLLEKGADVNAKDKEGNTALTWARKRGDTEIARILGGDGASEIRSATLQSSFSNAPADVKRAIEKSLALMQPSSVQFVKKTGCISCHHQSLGQMAVSAARAHGFHVNENLARQALSATVSVLAPHREAMLQAVPTIPASTIVSSYALLGLAAEHYPADEMTDALVHELAARQRTDGRWKADSSRPPLDQGDITATALCMRSLQLYPLPGRKQEFNRRIAKAREWLVATVPGTTQEKTLRLFGLAWAKADAARVQESAEALAAEQRADGGWSPLPTLQSDAYATGQVLVALHESGIVKASDRAYRDGVKFLLNTQLEDGSWHVKSRALGFQPYFESGYPHGHDQWISSAGAAWATMALALSAEPATVAARR